MKQHVISIISSTVHAKQPVPQNLAINSTFQGTDSFQVRRLLGSLQPDKDTGPDGVHARVRNS